MIERNIRKRPIPEIHNYTISKVKSVEIHQSMLYCMCMNLRELRISKELTQAEAAVIAGVSLESYKNHELGRSKADSPLGKMIFDRLVSYERFGFDHGILPIDYLEERVRGVLKGKEIDLAYLFGSYAKGTATEQSDVDLLISGKITGLDFFSLGGELERALHKHVDVLRLSDVISNQDLLAEILSVGTRIYDKNER